MKNKILGFLLLFVSLILIVGCGEDSLSTTQLSSEAEITTENELWLTIVDNEYVADNGWAGIGLYFYEDNDMKKADYMVFGSGLPVVAMYTADVSISENGNLEINLAFDLPSINVTELTTQMMTFIITYDSGELIVGDNVFVDRDTDLRAMCINMGYCGID